MGKTAGRASADKGVQEPNPPRGEGGPGLGSDSSEASVPMGSRVVEAHGRRLSLLGGALEALSTATTEAQVFQVAASSAAELLGGGGLVCTWCAPGHPVTASAHGVTCPASVEQVLSAVGPGLLQGRPLLSCREQGSSDQSWPAGCGEWMLSVPFAMSGGLGGALVAIGEGSPPTDGPRQEVMALLACQVGGALRRVELQRQTRELGERLHQVLARLGEAVTAAFSEADLLELIAQLGAELWGAELSEVWLRDPDGELRRRGWAKAPHASPWEPAEGGPQQAAELALQHTRPLAWCQSAADCEVASSRLPPALARAGVSCCLAVPFRIERRWAGALVLACCRERHVQAAKQESIISLVAHAAVALENLRLFQRMQQRLRELSDFSWVGSKVSASLQLPTILSAVTSGFSRGLGVPMVGVALCQRGDVSIPEGANLGLPADYAACFGCERLAGLAQKAFAERRAQALDEGRAEAWAAEPLTQGVQARSLICAPLIAREERLGVLFGLDVNLRVFDAHELALCLAYANQAALAAHNALLYQDVVGHLQRLSTVTELTRTLAGAESLDQALERLVAATAELMGAAVCVLRLLDAERGELFIRAAWGLPPEYLGQRLALGKGIAGLAAERNELVWAADVSRDGRFADRQKARRLALGAALAVPLRAYGRTLGTLSVYLHEVREFTPGEKGMLSLLADEAGIVLHSALCRQEMQRQAEHLYQSVRATRACWKHSLELVSRLLRLELEEGGQTKEQALSGILAHIELITQAQATLGWDQAEAVEAREVLHRVLSAVSQEQQRRATWIAHTVEGGRVGLSPRQAHALAVVVAELVGSVFVHSFRVGTQEVLRAEVAEARDTVSVRLRCGGGRSLPALDLGRAQRPGLHIVRKLVERELQGQFHCWRDETGTTAEIRFLRASRGA